MRRVLFVDVLRLLALLQMVNGHTLDAVLAESERLGPGYERYRFVRGLVSVAFLVVAGISYYLTTVSRLDQQPPSTQAARKRVLRAAGIVAIGYLLQARAASGYLDLQHSEALRTLFRCEVLQCIGLSLLLLELLTFSLRSAHKVTSACLLLAAGCFLLSPAAEQWSQQPGPGLMLALAGHGQGSQFPLFPWSGYVFAGVVMAHVSLRQRGETPRARTLLGLLASSACALLLSRLLRELPLGAAVHASSRPWFVLEKLAVIGLLLALLALLTHGLRRLPAALELLGSETLAIFVFHLQVIYGGSWALSQLFGRSLPLPAALLASAFNLSLSVAFAFGWRALKRRAQTNASRLASQSPWMRRSAA